jgi:acetylornithine aminotransferase
MYRLHDVVLILDDYNPGTEEAESFLHPNHNIKADIICLAKGVTDFYWRNLDFSIHSASYGLLGTSLWRKPFGLCCWNSSLDVIESQN